MIADAIAKVPLQLDRVVGDGAAGAARALQLGAEVLQERGVVRQVVDDGDGLAAATFLLHPQFGDDAVRHCFVGRALAAALAVFLGPAAAGADAPEAGRVDQAPLIAIAQATMVPGTGARYRYAVR